MPSDLGPAIEGIGEGMNRSIQTLRSTAAEVRNQPKEALQMQTLQEQSAMSHAAYQEWQKDQQPTPKEDLLKDPKGKMLFQYAQDQMPDTFTSDKESVTRGEKKMVGKHIVDHPDIFISYVEKSRKEASDNASKYDDGIQKLQEKMDKALPDEKADIAKQLEEEKGRQAPYLAMKQDLLNQEASLRMHIVEKERASMSKDDLLLSNSLRSKGGSGSAADVEAERARLKQKVGDDFASKTSEQLYDMSLHHADPVIRQRAKETLAAMKKDKIDLAKAQLDAKSKDIDINSLAKAVAEGQDSVDNIKGSMGNPVSSKVRSKVLELYPKFNFTYSKANANYITSTVNQRIIGATQASLPRISMLAEQADKLGNTSIPAINEVMKQVLTQTGSPTYTNFESNRNAIVQEVNTALSGSSQSSDMRIQIELQNIKSARSPQQLMGAIKNLNEALIARLDASTQYIYPQEVVRGEKDLGTWKKEMYARYRGKFLGGEQASSENKSNDMDKFWK